jgi:hypothetical protein
MSFIDIRGLTAGVVNWLGCGGIDLSADEGESVGNRREECSEKVDAA